jgi:integrase
LEDAAADERDKLVVRILADSGIRLGELLKLTATEQLRRGISPILLAQIVGHTSLTMINDVYQHLNQDDAHDALMRSLLADGRLGEGGAQTGRRLPRCPMASRCGECPGGLGGGGLPAHSHL